jgi:beta-glucosidase/6-phospho-beta-glucosidase/beta-galactosidase
MPFLFASGIDNGCPRLADGTRVDQMDASGHYARWEEDFVLARELGVRAMRYGPAYYRTHVAPDHFDWDPCDEPMRRLRALGIEVVATLCRFGVPSWLGGFQDAAFPVLFAEYARAFARRYPWVRHYTLIDQILRTAALSARWGVWNECERGDAPFVRALRNLCLAHELAVEAVLSERPDAVIVQVEALERFDGAVAREDADWWSAIQHVAFDLTLGGGAPPGVLGYLNAHGLDCNDLGFLRERRAPGQRWLGIAYHPAVGVGDAATGRRAATRGDPGLGRLAAALHARYRLPLFHAETGHAPVHAAAWLHEQWDELLALRAAGVPVRGFTWFALCDRVERREEVDGGRRHVHRAGLLDHNREARPVGDVFARLSHRWAPALANDECPDPPAAMGWAG